MCLISTESEKKVTVIRMCKNIILLRQTDSFIPKIWIFLLIKAIQVSWCLNEHVKKICFSDVSRTNRVLVKKTHLLKSIMLVTLMRF